MSSRAFPSFLASACSISYVSCTVGDPPSRTHVLLALRCLLSVSKMDNLKDVRMSPFKSCKGTSTGVTRYFGGGGCFSASPRSPTGLKGPRHLLPGNFRASHGVKVRLIIVPNTFGQRQCSRGDGLERWLSGGQISPFARGPRGYVLLAQVEAKAGLRYVMIRRQRPGDRVGVWGATGLAEAFL
jgi:hypothetical protein